MEAEALASDQGETAEKPIPVPSARSASDSAAAANAPAITAAQDTPDVCESFLLLVLIALSMLVNPLPGHSHTLWFRPRPNTIPDCGYALEPHRLSRRRIYMMICDMATSRPGSKVWE